MYSTEGVGALFVGVGGRVVLRSSREVVKLGATPN
jgi:hypothetical protein